VSPWRWTSATGRLRLLKPIPRLLRRDRGRRERLLSRAEASVDRRQLRGSVQARGAPEEDGHDLLGLFASLAKQPQRLAPLADLNRQRPQLTITSGDSARDFGDESSRRSDISLGSIPACRRRVRTRLKRLRPPRIVVKLRR
jgi:hypothetical protein